MPFFLHLNPDYIIKTLPNCIDENSPNKYQDAISANEFLKIRLEEINLNNIELYYISESISSSFLLLLPNTLTLFT